MLATITAALRRFITPAALSVAVIALALGGTATAAALISGSQIKRNSIPANRLTAKARAALHGAAGPAGAAGAVGAPGALGPIGASGAAGSSGAAASDGQPGPVGAASTVPGPQGPQGPAGANGSDGARGLPGSDCSGAPPIPGLPARQCPGAKGDTGPVGPPGDPCPSTDPACVGPPGAKGDQGDVGPIGPKGDPGSVAQVFTVTTGGIPLGAGEDLHSVSARCPDGSSVVAGGGRTVENLPIMRGSFRADAQTWTVQWASGNTNAVVEVQAYCAAA